MALTIEKATRTNRKVRVLIYGPSGGGKTTSAIRIATGICDAGVDDGRQGIVVFDTENSVDLLAGPGGYTFDKVKPERDPASGKLKLGPDAFIEFLDLVEKQQTKVAVIDSMTHLWQTALDTVDTINRTKNKGIAAWSDVKPGLRKMVQRLLNFDGHLIVTLRSKTEWQIGNNGTGKGSVQKIGTAPVFEQGIEYEFDVVISISPEHIATCEKDRFGIFQDNTYEKPSEQFGRAMIEALVDNVDGEADDHMTELLQAAGELRDAVVDAGHADKVSPDMQAWTNTQSLDWVRTRAALESEQVTLEYIIQLRKRAQESKKGKQTK